MLAKRFLDKYSAIHGKKLRGFTDKAKRALLTYPWSGNIREMQNVIERGVILAPNGTRIEREQMFSVSGEEQALELGVDGKGGLGANRWAFSKDLCEAVFNGVVTLDEVEAMLIETAVDRVRGNLASAARKLGLTRRQLAYWLKRLQEGEPAGAGGNV